MSIEELIVVIVCLLIGYFVVAKLIAEHDRLGPTEDNNAPPHNEPPHDATPATEPQQERWYEVLKVSRDATPEQIHEAYKNLIRQYHPDKVSNLGVELQALAEEKSKAINVAYQEGLKARGQ
ncbi:MAG: J domain-containing protein [Gallionellaceae bacterium]|jgi:DnaJ-domain-containing protein 1|nr:J domain-containing protein [Gallionellaceae bacterium]